MRMQDAPKDPMEIPDLPDWTLAPGRAFLSRTLTFGSLREALCFMSEVSAHADRVDHHPEWVHRSKEVTIKLTTHSDACVTWKDYHFAIFVDHVLKNFSWIGGSGAVPDTNSPRNE